MKHVPKVSVIVPHYNDLGGLDRCLRKLEKQTFPSNEFEIVVADNWSPVDRDDLMRVLNGRATLVVVGERGAGPARNGGVALATGEILAFIDSDCQAETTWIEEGVRALSHFDFVGGRVEVLVHDELRMTGAEAFERIFAFDFANYIKKKGFAGSGNLFCPRHVFDRVGGFRTGVSEDVDWCHRATKLGYRLGYAPHAAVGHPARATWEELKTKWRRVNREMYYLQAHSRLGGLRWLLRSLALPISAVVHSPRVMFSGKLNSAEQRARALGILWRLRFWRFSDSIQLALSNVGKR